MRAEDYRDALALYAEAEQRSTAQLIELVTAAVLLKLAPPSGKNVSSVTISPSDLDDLLATHYVQADYEPGGMRVSLTLLDPK